MARKRRRQLGHITDSEKKKVRLSIAESVHACRRKYGPALRAACIEGVETVEYYLKGEGF